MSTINDEMLMRWSDGELGPDAVAHLEASARADPALAARMEAMKASRRLLADAFPAHHDPRDIDLTRRIFAFRAVAEQAGPFGDLRAWLRDLLEPRNALPWAGVAAAAFVGGLLLSTPADQNAGFEMRVDGTLSDAGLERVLDERLALEGSDDQGRSIGLTYRDVDGRWCRTFRSERAGWGGLACRSDSGWTVTALAALEPPRGEIRTASSDTPAAILAAIDETISGTTVDADGEAKAKETGWPKLKTDESVVVAP